jgi:hypothetical protein
MPAAVALKVVCTRPCPGSSSLPGRAGRYGAAELPAVIRVVLLFLGAYIVASLTAGWWLPPPRGSAGAEEAAGRLRDIWHGPPR